jgi:DNA-binding NarL/FixJ family response regulator
MNQIDQAETTMDQSLSAPIRIAILDDHQGIIDGYRYRLDNEPDMEVVADASYGENLETMLLEQVIDLLILDVYVPTSPKNANPYPILYTIPRLLDRFPDLVVVVISVISRPALIRAVIEAGVSGYILKDDRTALSDLGGIIRTVMKDGVYLSRDAQQQFTDKYFHEIELSKRQQEALSLCAAFPNMTTAQLARKLGIANSTFRNLLSQAYLRLEVSNRSGAIIQAQRLGLISPPDAETPG